MDKVPAIVTLGAALLGFVAGEMAVSDAAVHDWFETHFAGLDYTVSLTGAVVVVAVGLWLSRRGQSLER
jgi:predicted tellurium resistance membrane protein TerC